MKTAITSILAIFYFRLDVCLFVFIEQTRFVTDRQIATQRQTDGQTIMGKTICLTQMGDDIITNLNRKQNGQLLLR